MIEDGMLVSIIIPTYNCERYISQTIDSVLAQDYNAIELLIIDDGSTDNTKKIVLDYGDRLRLISRKNSGVCVARNMGLAEAKGQFICWMDHDDYWYPDKISQQVKAFNRHDDVGVVYSNFTRWNSNSAGIFPTPDSYIKKSFIDKFDPEHSGWIYHLFLLDCYMLTSTAMFRRDVFEKCGAFDESLPYGEDWDLWLRISREYPFLKLNQSTTLYRQHQGQGSRMVRGVDYRTMILSDARDKWGLYSRDGRHLSEWQFRRQLANYHASFALNLLKANQKKRAIMSFLRAWTTYPFKVKFIGYLLAGVVGWKPNW